MSRIRELVDLMARARRVDAVWLGLAVGGMFGVFAALSAIRCLP